MGSLGRWPHMVAPARPGASGASVAWSAPDVEELRARPLLRLPDAHVLPCDHPRDLALGVVEVAGEDRPLGADDDARGLEPPLHPVGAEVALGGRVRVGIDVERVVGARLHARLAADAPVAVEIDDAVGPPVQRHRGADRHARARCRSGCSGGPRSAGGCSETRPSRRTSPTSGTCRAERGSPPCTPPCRRGTRCTASGRSRIRSARAIPSLSSGRARRPRRGASPARSARRGWPAGRRVGARWLSGRRPARRRRRRPRRPPSARAAPGRSRASR